MGFMPQRIADTPEEHDGPHPLGLDVPGVDRSPMAELMCGIEGHHVHTQDRQWSSKRLFYWRTYDAAAFDEWTAYRKERVRPSARQLFWRPGSIASGSYDTFDAVLSLGAVTDAGLCMECGGHRQRRRCECGKTHTSRARSRVVIPETDTTPSVAVELNSPGLVTGLEPEPREYSAKALTDQAIRRDI